MGTGAHVVLRPNVWPSVKIDAIRGLSCRSSRHRRDARMHSGWELLHSDECFVIFCDALYLRLCFLINDH